MQVDKWVEQFALRLSLFQCLDDLTIWSGFPKSAEGNQYAVVVMDYLTKWPEVFATQDQSALTIAKLFVQEVVCRHGVPAQLLLDRGKFSSHS